MLDEDSELTVEGWNEVWGELSQLFKSLKKSKEV